MDYVLKPFVPEVLRAKVASFVELARKTRYPVLPKIGFHARCTRSVSVPPEASAIRRAMRELSISHPLLWINSHYDQHLADLTLGKTSDAVFLDGKRDAERKHIDEASDSLLAVMYGFHGLPSGRRLRKSHSRAVIERS